MCGKMLFLSLVIHEDLAVNCLSIPRVVLKILGYRHAEATCVACMVPANLHEMQRCVGRGFSVPGDTRGSCCKLFVYPVRGAENIRVYACRSILCHLYGAIKTP
jgi:hypothetical protein